jgi:hypothetical protein
MIDSTARCDRGRVIRVGLVVESIIYGGGAAAA